MKDEKKTIEMAAKVGAIFGVLAFLVFGLLHGLYVSSLGTLAILNFLSGGLLQPTVSVQIISVLGILLGIVLLAMLSGGVGALFGTVFGYVLESKAVSVLSIQKKRVEPAEAESAKMMKEGGIAYKSYSGGKAL